MTWATLAHVSNDWLAVPVAVWTLVALNRYILDPSLRGAALAAVALVVGLLTKAYFLAFVPLLVGVCALRRRWKDLAAAFGILFVLAGPWYGQNLVRYGVLTGTQEARDGVGIRAALHGAGTLNWLAAIPSSARWALWTGNNSFLAFSAKTLDILIVGILMALLLWGMSRHSAPEWTTVSYCGLFFGALGYEAATNYVYTHGAATGSGPWHAQVLSAPVLGLAFLGSSRNEKFGRVVASVLVLLFGYVLFATYAVKLIPLYGGYEGRTSLRELALLYTHGSGQLIENLRQVTLGPPLVVCGLAATTVLLAVAQSIGVMQGLLRGKDESS